MPTLYLYGIDPALAPLAVREELAFSKSEIVQFLPQLLDPPVIAESFILSTCNRTEIYLVVEGECPQCPLEALRRWRPQARVLHDHCSRYHLNGSAAVEHLFSVAAALRSQMPGDSQISNQIAGAAQLARDAGTLGAYLEHTLAAALRCAKTVRRETGLTAGSAGLGPAILHRLRRHYVGAGPIRILLLGAGDVAREVAGHLAKAASERLRWRNKPGNATVEIVGIWSRTPASARFLADLVGSKSLSKNAAIDALVSADPVIGACRGRVDILAWESLSPILELRRRPLTVIDLGVPRNLDPLAAPLDGLHAISLDELQQQVRDRTNTGQSILAKAADIVSQQVERWSQWHRQRPLQPFRADLYGSIESASARLRTIDPVGARLLRVALHRTLEQSFAQLSLTDS